MHHSIKGFGKIQKHYLVGLLFLSLIVNDTFENVVIFKASFHRYKSFLSFAGGYSCLNLLSHILPAILISKLPIVIGLQSPNFTLSFTAFSGQMALHLIASSGISELHHLLNIAEISSVDRSLMSLSLHLSGPESVFLLIPLSASLTSTIGIVVLRWDISLLGGISCFCSF